MLLHRFPIKVIPDADAAKKSANSMSVLVSLYRKNVDVNYQNLVCKKIAEGKLDSYICMMIVCLVNNGECVNKIKRHQLMICFRYPYSNTKRTRASHHD